MSEQSLDNFGQVWREDMKAMFTDDTPFKPNLIPAKDLELFSQITQNHGLNSDLIDQIRNTYQSMD